MKRLGAFNCRVALCGLLLGVFPALTLAENTTETITADTATTLSFLRVNGSRIIDSAGNTVYLRGVNMDNGYYSYTWNPAASWNYASESDIQYLKSLGVNSIRVVLNWRFFETDFGYKLINRYLNWCKKYGVYVILDMHIVPTSDDVDRSTSPIWTDSTAQQKLVDLWVDIASHYANNPTVAGYDLFNEPSPADENQWWDLANRLAASIRNVDSRHLLFVEPSAMGTGNLRRINDNKTVYSFHDYTPFLVTHAGVTWASDSAIPNNYRYPGYVITGTTWANWSSDANNFTNVISGWQYLDSGALSVPEGVEFAALKLAIANNAGNVWFDDLSWSKNGVELPITNSSMEQASMWDSGSPALWHFWTGDNVSGSWDSRVAHSGSHSLKLQNTSDNGFGVWTYSDVGNYVKPLAPVKAGDTLRIKGWVYAPNNHGSVSLGVDYVNGQYQYYNKAALQKVMNPFINWAKQNRVPLYVGEFGAVSRSLGNSRYNITDEKMSIFNTAGLSWSLWTYRDNEPSGFGMYHSKTKLDTKMADTLKAGLQ